MLQEGEESWEEAGGAHDKCHMALNRPTCPQRALQGASEPSLGRQGKRDRQKEQGVWKTPGDPPSRSSVAAQMCAGATAAKTAATSFTEGTPRSSTRGACNPMVLTEHNTQPQTQVLETTQTCYLTVSRVRKHRRGVLHSGSYEADIKWLAGAVFPSEVPGCLLSSLVVARIQFLAAEGLRSLCLAVLSCWGRLPCGPPHNMDVCSSKATGPHLCCFESLWLLCVSPRPRKVSF